MKRKYSVVLLLCLLLCSFSVEAEEVQGQNKHKQTKVPYKEEIEAEGYKYTYEGIPVTGSEKYGEIFYKGKITIKDADGNVIYQETLPLEPRMCDKFPLISKQPFKLPSHALFGGDHNKERWLVITCGSSSGRHQTLKIFSQHPISGIRTTSLEFGDTTPNLTDIDSDGLYEAKVSRRIFIPKTESGLQNYLVIYKLHMDDVFFGFIPIFGPETEKPYLDYYLWQKESLIRRTKDEALSGEDKKILFKANAGQILAALISTQNKKRICTEIGSLRKYGLTTEELEAWVVKLKDLGYPDFNFNLCEEVSK